MTTTLDTAVAPDLEAPAADTTPSAKSDPPSDDPLQLLRRSRQFGPPRNGWSTLHSLLRDRGVSGSQLDWLTAAELLDAEGRLAGVLDELWHVLQAPCYAPELAAFDATFPRSVYKRPEPKARIPIKSAD